VPTCQCLTTLHYSVMARLRLVTAEVEPIASLAPPSERDLERTASRLERDAGLEP
jgi:hypothetical protein